MDSLVVDHPLAASLLTILRDERSDNAAFRHALRRLTQMLVYEAVRDAPTETFDVKTPVAVTTGVRLQQPPLLVPVLRAGLGMVEQAHALIPQAQVGFVGLARDEKTFEPVPYLESLPEDLSGLPVFVLDPMLATGVDGAHPRHPRPARCHGYHRDLCGRGAAGRRGPCCLGSSGPVGHGVGR